MIGGGFVSKIFILILFAFVASSCSWTEASKKKASYHLQMGESYLREQNLTSALVELTEAEKYTPDDPQLLNFLGIVYFNRGKYELAEQKYLKAIDIKPTFSEARNHLAVNYMEMQRWDDAILQLKTVTDDLFYEGQEVASVNLGLAYLGKGEGEKALNVMRGAVISYPRNPQARVTLGRVYFFLNRIELSIDEFKKAIELSSGYINAHYWLGLAYLKINDNNAARKSFQEVLKLGPDTTLGRQSREHLDLLR